MSINKVLAGLPIADVDTQQHRRAFLM